MKKNKLKEYLEILRKNNILLEENISEELKEKEINIVTYDSREVKPIKFRIYCIIITSICNNDNYSYRRYI